MNFRFFSCTKSASPKAAHLGLHPSLGWFQNPGPWSLLQERELLHFGPAERQAGVSGDRDAGSHQPGLAECIADEPVSSVEPLTPLTFVPGTIDFSLFPTDIMLAPQWTPPQDQEYLIVPGDDGGCEGIAQAYSPRTKYVYYGTRYEPTTFKPPSRIRLAAEAFAWGPPLKK